VGAATVVGGAAIGAAMAYPHHNYNYYNQPCGYYPYPRCY
jgi:hypothetical protein